jgi:hypothetical protein
MNVRIRLTSRSAAIAALVLTTTGALAAPPDPAALSRNPQPVPITVLKLSRDTARGLIFLTPNATDPTLAHGAQIVDDWGRPAWFNPLPSGTGAYDLRVQHYRGEPVVTWIQSQGAFSTGPTTDVIADRRYHVIATVQAGHGLTADIHEFHLTAQNTALITIYNTVPRDLSAVGGPANGRVTEGIIQEIDVANGHVLFEWHSLDHIGLDESHEPLPTSLTSAWDYFHLNAVSVDEDGNLLVGARHTWAIYRLNRRSGEVLWRLGGKKSDFALGPNVQFAWQHNPTAVDDHGLVRIFDNEAAPAVLPYSRVIWVRHDDRNGTATLERWLKHPEGLSAGSQGNAQGLANGDTFVGWGQLPRFSEFDRHDGLVFDASLPANYNSYRAYRHEWVGEPDTRPTATARRTFDGDTVVHAIWNGATEVARWEVLDADGDDASGHADRDDRRPVASADWNGLDTAIQTDAYLRSVVVIARDHAARAIGRSAVTLVSP